MCSALYLNVLEVNLPHDRASRRTLRTLQTRYPINFVVKHHAPSAFAEKPSPEALETCRLSSFTEPACLRIDVTSYRSGSEPEQ